ncbi:MAG: putative capsular polysaccharide synthesis family protein [Hyphomonadaceae bacterium]|nr:putative capsular polysaccharide synthesis family protein [Hyphomonadaceae bacterium]
MVPLLIHQMGRVGSTSIYNAVKDLPEYRTYHTHILNRQKLHQYVTRRRNGRLKMPNHVYDSFEVISTVLGLEPKIKIISLVREPMARNVSAFFNNLDSFGFRSKAAREDAKAEELLERFAAYDHKIPVHWFSEEIRDVFGFTIFNTPFSHEKKRLVIQKDGISVLVLRVEDSDEEKCAAICDFLEVDTVTFTEDNVGSGKFGPEYEKFKHLFNPSQKLVDSVLNSRLVSHFYTDEEIQGMRRKWASQEFDMPASG